MSGKFDMKLVIDSVTTPLLYAMLSAEDSPRRRAAMLRSMAEEALRARRDFSSALEKPIARAVTMAQPLDDLPSTTTENEVRPELAQPRSTRATNEPVAFEGDDIAEQLVQYLDF
jgi:CO/xanthine dehydrogenase Mo-binding subunit